jgi:hypothetical protein
MLRKLGFVLSTAVLAAGLAACSSAGQSSAPAASASPASQSAAPAGGTGPGAGAGPNAFGTVASVNGSTLTLNNPRGGSPITVQLTSSTTINKQVTGALTDAKTGEPVVAIGQQVNGVLQARQIRLGAGLPGGRFGGPGVGSRPRANGAAGGPGTGSSGPPAGAPTRVGATNVSFVRGTVASVSGNTLTITASDGTTTQVQLATNGQVMEQANGTTADLKAGEQVAATGTRQGSTLTATTIDIGPGRPALGGRGPPPLIGPKRPPACAGGRPDGCRPRVRSRSRFEPAPGHRRRLATGRRRSMRTAPRPPPEWR